MSLSVGAVNGNGINANASLNSPGYKRSDRMFDSNNSKDVFGRLGADIGPVTDLSLADSGYAASNPSEWISNLNPELAVLNVSAADENGMPDSEVLDPIALQTARAFFDQALIVWSWNAAHGGVYVPVTDATRPNPYLEDPRRSQPPSISASGIK